MNDCCHNNSKIKTEPVTGMLCYCFKYFEEDFIKAVKDNKESDLLDEIKSKMKDPGCFCETANPSEKCCLADINKFIKEEKLK